MPWSIIFANRIYEQNENGISLAIKKRGCYNENRTEGAAASAAFSKIEG